MLPAYSKELEQQMQELYRRLSEKNKRQYAAIEALKLSYGGISYIAKLFGCSRDTIRSVLKKHDYVKRKALKKKAAGGHVNRNAQFERIKALRQDYETAGNPIISVDTKKKELLGNLYREGRLYTRETLEVSDHDFPSLADGVVIPHGIYDVVRNEATVNIGTSRDTGEFACDSIGHWWTTQGQLAYPNATSLLMLMDGGGSNSSRHYLFKQDLQALADALGMPIRVAHYPPYTSKWNPIEHRVFPHVTRALQGVIFKSHELVKELIETTTTQNGLTVKANIIDKVYMIGRKVVDGFKKSMRILFDDHLGRWNYVAAPQHG
jgi:hypothetical protein